MILPPPISTLFPYTTLFRSNGRICVTQRSRTLITALGRVLLGRWCVARSEEHRLNSSHVESSYAVFCLKKKNPGGRGPVSSELGSWRWAWCCLGGSHAACVA